MKKLFLSFIMLIAGCNALGMGAVGEYVPASGPLQLGEKNHNPGCIMQIIANNQAAKPGADPQLAAANTALAIFDGRGQNFSRYQTIMTNLRQATNTAQTLNALQAIETVIMHMYDYRAYMLGSYRPIQSIFLTGIRWNWINPLSYISPKSWISDNDLELNQLIDELDNLANIAYLHDSIMGTRLKATVHSYRHWRRNLALSCIAYLAADVYSQGFKKSIINTLYKDGLAGFEKIGYNIGSDAKKGIKWGYKNITAAISCVWNRALKPIGKGILYGARGKKGNNNDNNDNDDNNDDDENANQKGYWQWFKNAIKPKETNDSQSENNDIEESKPYHLKPWLYDGWKDFVKKFLIAKKQKSTQE